MATIKVATCVPKQERDRKPKLAGLDSTMKELADQGVQALFTPQEYFGGTVMMNHDLHMELEFVKKHGGALAKKYKMVLGLGAATKQKTGGATEDYHYFESDGTYVGYHRKFALPSYDDARTKGAGKLWPETSYKNRTTPVELRSLGMRVGTVFCWEVFSRTLFAAYTFQKCNTIIHPIKFAPRGWLKLRPAKETDSGLKEVIGFDQAPESTQWTDKLKAASRHECLCHILVSCNTWNLGEKYMALCGHVDEVFGTTQLLDLPSTPDQNHVHIVEFNPACHDGTYNMHNMGSYASVVGDLEGYDKLREFTMHIKMRRLEAQLIGGTTLLDCMTYATRQQQKKHKAGMLAATGKSKPKKK